MDRWVVDTNVLLAADISPSPRLATHLSLSCREHSLEWLEAFLERQDRLVVDEGWKILNEYQRKTQPDDYASFFVREILSRSLVDPVSIEMDETDSACLPDGLLETVHDLADRKFVAVALAHPDRPTIVNSADTDWLDWQDDLAKFRIYCLHLCAEELTQMAENKRKKKHKGKH